MARRLFPVGGLASAAAVAALGCAAGGIGFGGRPVRPPFPDAAAVEAGARARAVFEKERRRYGGGGELTARVGEVGRAAVREHFGEEAPGAAPADGWRFVVTDGAAPEAFLFADGSVFVTRGALAALGGERSLGALFRSAAVRYADRAFRGADGSLIPQPIRVPLPGEGSPGTDPPTAGDVAGALSGDPADERWITLLDGLAYGEPPERGGARGRDLYLPRAGLRLRAPPGYLFAPGAGGRHAASRGLRPDLLVEELEPGRSAARAAARALAVGPDGVFDAEGVGEQRRRTRELARRLLERAGDRPIEFVEAVRSPGIRGVAARLGAPGFLALLDAPRRLVEVRLDCGPRALAACENSFMAMLRSAAPFRSGAAPGWLRLRAARVPRPGPARRVLDAFVESGESEVPAFVLRELNRARLDRPARPGDLLLVARRDPAPSGTPASGRPVPESPAGRRLGR